MAFALFLGGCKTVPEGKTSVDAVAVHGTKAIDADDVAEKIATAPTPKFLWLFRGILYEYSVFDKFTLQRDLARVEAFYRTKGYYDVHARAGRITKVDDKHVRVEIVVEEGVPIRVRNIRFEGLESLREADRNAAMAVARSKMPKDKVFDEDTFKETEAAVRRALADRSFAYVQVKGTATVDVVDHMADMIFRVQPGPPCKFGEVTIEGYQKLPEKTIRRAIDIKPNQPYSLATIDASQQAVLDLNVFASAEFVPQLGQTKDEHADTDANEDPAAAELEKKQKTLPDPPPPDVDGKVVVPLLVRLEVTRLKSVKLGGGIEFDALKTDLHAVIGWEHRNFLGGMRTFSVTFRPGVVFYPLRVSNIVAPTHFLPEERLTLELRQPSFPEARTNAFVRPQFDVYPVLLNPNPEPGTPVLGYAEFRMPFGIDRTLWKLYTAISFNTQVDFPFSYIGPKNENLSTILITYPELYTVFDFRNDKIHPRKGLYLANTLQYAGGIFPGSAHDFKIQPDVRGYIPVAKKTTLALRASVGFIQPYNYGAAVTSQPSEYEVRNDPQSTKDYQLTFFRGFFSGGPSSNRGYPIRGVGPWAAVPFLTPDAQQAQIEQNGCFANCRTPTGGFTLWEASAEMRFALNGPLSVATFCDASDVSPHVNDIRLSHLHLSCGAGARYDTPVGPIRVDIGYRLPGLQVLGGLTPDEQPPGDFLGIPIALHIGIGEAY